MAEAENLVLEHLRHMRGQLDRMELPSACRTRVADHSVQLAEINSKLDRFDARVTSIKKRRDLIEGQTSIAIS
jgi:hypothetical protein